MTDGVLFQRHLFRRSAGMDASSSKLSPIKIRLMSSSSDLREIFRLRYRAYHHDGHLPFDPAEQFSDINDGNRATVHIAACTGHAFVGALRVNFASGEAEAVGLPCAPYYPEVAILSHRPGHRLVEFSRLAVDPDITNTSFKGTVYAALVRAALIVAQARDATDILVATKPSMVKFYELLVGFERLGRPAKYPPGNLDITLMRLTMQQALRRQKMQNRFFRNSEDEVASMRRAIERALAAMPSRAE